MPPPNDPKEDNSNPSVDLTPNHNEHFVVPLIRIDGHIDELTEGYKLAPVTLASYGSLSVSPVLNFDNSAGDTTLVLPLENRVGGFIDITTGTQEFNINTDLNSTVLLTGSILQVRKVDASVGTIIFTDNEGIVYDFINTQGEFITLLKTPTTLRVI